MENFTVISAKKIQELPKNSGVYCFVKNKKLIYIGKAINIKERVKNHFFQPTYKDALFIKNVKKIGYWQTSSEIEALVLEAALIKKYQPKFNSVWRDDKNYFYVAITKSTHPYVFITHQKDSITTHYIGPFVEGNAVKKTVKYLRRVFPYYTAKTHPKMKCTWCHLDLCPGPNPDVPGYKKNLKKLALVLQGKSKRVFWDLKKEMDAASRANHFERAATIRDRLQALQRIMEHTHVIETRYLSPGAWQMANEKLQGILGLEAHVSKIECYDISNIQGKNAVGSMVVFVDGVPDKSQYKKFRIRMKNEPNDIAMLQEVLSRRLAHPEWLYPEIMLIDGGIAQLNVAIRAKNQHPKAKNIKIISIAKGRRELFIEGKTKAIPLRDLPQEIYNLIVHLDDQAHRFAITYHKKLRKKALLQDA